MVAHDKEFIVDLTQLTEEQLRTRRQKFVSTLYAGYEGSMDNVEKKALIAEIDKEFERRNKKGENKRANVAIAISILALVVSVGGFALNIWERIY